MKGQRGQTLTEAVLWGPVFLATAFFGLQVCHLGLVIIMTNYAASSLVRKVVEDTSLSASAASGETDITALQPDFEKLCSAGMRFGQLKAAPALPDGTIASGENATTIRLTAYAKLSPLPMMGVFLAPIFRRGERGDDLGFPCVGSVCLEEENSRTYFWVRGRAYARLNYH